MMQDQFIMLVMAWRHCVGDYASWVWHISTFFSVLLWAQHYIDRSLPTTCHENPWTYFSRRSLTLMSLQGNDNIQASCGTCKSSSIEKIFYEHTSSTNWNIIHTETYWIIHFTKKNVIIWCTLVMLLELILCSRHTSFSGVKCPI